MDKNIYKREISELSLEKGQVVKFEDGYNVLIEKSPVEFYMFSLTKEGEKYKIDNKPLEGKAMYSKLIFKYEDYIQIAYDGTCEHYNLYVKDENFEKRLKEECEALYLTLFDLNDDVLDYKDEFSIRYYISKELKDKIFNSLNDNEKYLSDLFDTTKDLIKINTDTEKAEFVFYNNKNLKIILSQIIINAQDLESIDIDDISMKFYDNLNFLVEIGGARGSFIRKFLNI